MKDKNFMRVPVIVAIAITLAACGTGSERAENVPLNFVLIFTDEMDPGYLECYNSESPFPTPRITELAGAGTRFTSAYVAAPMCTPSRFAVLTGKYPGRCTGESFLRQYPPDMPYSIAWNTRINKPVQTIADFLSEAGYVSGMAGKWHVGEEDPDRTGIPQFTGEEDPDQTGIPQVTGEEDPDRTGIPQVTGEEDPDQTGIPQFTGEEDPDQTGIPQLTGEEDPAQTGIPQLTGEEDPDQTGIPQLTGEEEPDHADIPEFSGDEDVSDPGVDEKLRQHQQAMQQRVRETAGFDEAYSVLWGNFDGFPVRQLRVHNIPWITMGALKFLDERVDDRKPFFLYVTPTAVHGPAHQRSLQWNPVYTPEGKVEEVAEFDIDREALREEIRSRPGSDSHKYVGLSYIDHQVGMIMEHLRKNGLLDHTVVIFMADHNVEPGKATCYEKGNKVPLVVRWPGRPASHVCGQLVQSVDLVRTIVEAAGVRFTAQEDLDGVNMASLLNENADPVRESVYMESGYARAVRAGKYKYIAFRPPETAIEKMKEGETDYAPNQLDVHKQAHSQIAMQYFPHYFDQDQLYDLEEDPYELNNLAYLEEYRDVLEEMKGILQGYLDSFRHPYDLERIPFMETGTYRQMMEKTRDIGTDHIEWFSRDHGGLAYPPEKQDAQN